MNILATSYTLSQKSLDIYVAGCTPPHCENCHNPEAWNFMQGSVYDHKYFLDIKNKVIQFEPLVERFFIMGGEPLDQPIDRLEYLLMDMASMGKEVWLFTRYELSEIPPVIKYWCDYIKTGKYDTSLASDNHISHGIKLASTNQRVWARKEFYDVQSSSL